MSWQAVKDLALTQGYYLACRRRKESHSRVLARSERVVVLYQGKRFCGGQVTTRLRVCLVGLKLLQQALRGYL